MTSLRLRLIIIGFFALSLAAAAQVRVVVLPFRNMAHDIKYTPWNYQFADSLRSALLEADPSGTTYQIVSADSVELALADLNLDPDNPQYESDMWKAVRNLKAQKAVQGNFQLRGDRVLINCYIYDMESMLADATNQAKDIYKSPTTFLEAIRPIVKRILPGLSPQ
jgi:TolB-like protein